MNIGLSLALAFLLAPISALAQDRVGGTTVDLHPFWTAFQPILETVVGAVVTAALSWAAVQFTRLTGHQIEQKHMDALDSAAKTGLGKFFTKVGSSPMTVDARSQAVAEAIDWMQRSVPDALAATGLDSPVRRDKLGELVEGKLGQMLLGSGAAPTQT
jgi:hypothetical protein